MFQNRNPKCLSYWKELYYSHWDLPLDRKNRYPKSIYEELLCVKLLPLARLCVVTVPELSSFAAVKARGQYAYAIAKQLHGDFPCMASTSIVFGLALNTLLLEAQQANGPE